MPFAVSKWPSSGDPRNPGHLLIGFEYGARAPWAWLVQSVDANGWAAELATGVRISQIFADVEQGQFARDPQPPLSIEVNASPFGYEPPVVSPPGATLNWLFAIVGAGGEIAAESLWLTLPNAIQVFTFENLAFFGADPSTIPNPVTMTPIKWDA